MQDKRDISHEASFPQLPDDTELWRYTDLPKFLWVLTKKALYLSRGDLLGDALRVPCRGAIFRLSGIG